MIRFNYGNKKVEQEIREFYDREFPDIPYTKAHLKLLDYWIKNHTTTKKQDRLIKVENMNMDMDADMKIATISQNFMQKINRMCILSFPVEDIWKYYKQTVKKVKKVEQSKYMRVRISAIDDIETMQSLFNQIQMIKDLRINGRRAYSRNDILNMGWLEIDQQYRLCYEQVQQ